jgi:hypothetical protein
MAKELLAGFSGAFVDREVETRGLDFIDKEKAKRQGTSWFGDSTAETRLMHIFHSSTASRAGL